MAQAYYFPTLRKKREGWGTLLCGGACGLWICFCYLGHDFAYAFWTFWAQVVFDQAFAQELETFFRVIHDLEEFEVFGRDGGAVDHGLEVDQLFPIFAAVDHYQDFLCQLLRLG